MRLFVVVKKWWWLLLLVAAVGTGVYFRNENSKAKEIKNKTYTVKKQNLSDSLEISGSIDAREKVNLRFQTSGMLAWVGVKEGDMVKKYQVLANLDQRELRNQFQQLLNTYSKQRNDFEQVQSDNKNWETNGMSDTARDAVKRVIQNEQSDLNNSVLDVEAKDLSLKFSILYTPIAGLVTKVDVPLAGQNITPASATIEIINPNSLYFSATADQTEVVKFFQGQKGTISLDAYPDETIEAMVSSVGFVPKSGSAGVVYEIKFDFESSNSALPVKMGMTGDINLVFGEKKDVLAVPERYIKEKLGKTFATLFKDRKKKEVEIKTGYKADGMVEIVEGLNENDVIYND